jgi:hypothetical protein
VIRFERAQPGHARVGEPDPDRASDARQQHALGEEIAGQPISSGTERGPHGQLTPPSHGPSELEVGHVRARDEQHQQDRAGQHEERPPEVAHDLVEQRHGAEGEAAAWRVDLGEVAAQPRGERIELGLGGID